MKKRIYIIIALLVMAAMMFTACSAGKAEAEANGTTDASEAVSVSEESTTEAASAESTTESTTAAAETTIHYLTAAADQNNPFAAFSLGKIYASGDENYRIDLFKASEWNCKAYSGFLEMVKEDTDGTILYKLGNMNLKGIGTAQNINQALHFFTASAQKGNQYAQYAIGKLYYEGKWVTRDINTAKENFRASAAQGNTAAQRKLFYISKESETQTKSSYASSLLLSRLAFAMSNLAMHASFNKQQQEEEEKEKEQKQQPKFASRNHHRSNARLTVQNPMQY